MSRLSRTLTSAARPALAVLLVFAQALAAFGFPILQTHRTVKACGCVMPCGSTSDNCCCTKPAPLPEPKKPKCAKCRTDEPPAEPRVKWVAAFKARQCRGENAGGVLAELPTIPPVESSLPKIAPVVEDRLVLSDSALASVSLTSLDPPPRQI
jgi:hypothetical protein